MDPVNLAIFWPLWALAGGGETGAVLGWNLVHLVSVLLAGWGGWRLGRVVFEQPQAAAVVAAACAGAPYLLGATGVVGRTEYLPMAIWALHLSFLLPALQPKPVRSAQIGAILTLVAMTHGGWQPLTWILFAELLLVLVLFRQQPRGAVLKQLALVMVPAGLLTLPLLLSHLGTEPWWLERLSHPSPFEERPRAAYLIALLPLVDTTRSWANTPLAYLGVTLPLLAMLGMWADWKRAGRWLLPGVVVLVFALGELVAVGFSPDREDFYYMPAAVLMHVVAPLRAFHGWPRLTMLVVPLVAVAAGFAVERAAKEEPRRALIAAAVLALLLVIEGATWSPVGRGSFTIAVPDTLAEAYDALPPGPVLELPLGMSPEHTDRALLRAQVLERPTSLVPSPHQPAALQLSAIAWSIEQGTALSRHRCASSEAARLSRAGFVGVVLHGELLPEGEVTPASITELLGAPVATADQTLVWHLQATGDVPSGCEEMEKLSILR